MQLLSVAFLVFVPLVACNRRQVDQSTVLGRALTRECYDIIYRHTCEDTSYQQDGADIALRCGENYLPFAESYATTCIRGDDGEFCAHFFTESDNNYLDIAAECASITNLNSTCPTSCRNTLQAVVGEFGCCFRVIFNERLSQLLLGQSVDLALDVCGVTAISACRNNFDLTVPANTDSCTPNEFWTRTANYLCDTEVGQPYIDALLENPDCLPIARHYANACSLGRNGTYCLDLFGTSFNPAAPTRTVFRNPTLNAVVESCANYSTFTTSEESCPTSCRNALNVAISEMGCCVNHFNDTVNEVTLPHFNGDVVAVCDIQSPGTCISDFRLDSGSSTITAASLWIYILCSSFAFVRGLLV